MGPNGFNLWNPNLVSVAVTAVRWLIGIIYAINHVVGCMRPGMAVKFRFTK